MKVVLFCGGLGTRLREISEADFWINGGFFIMRNEIFDHINSGEELVAQPFNRLVEKRSLSAYPHNGYWRAMDTFKDKIEFDRFYARGDAPWEVWKS